VTDTAPRPTHPIVTHVTQAVAELEAAGLEHEQARQDAGVIARFVLGWDLEHWLGHQRDDEPDGFVERFRALIARRATREPVQYITGEREFYWRNFAVTSAVLIPRPETEMVVEAALIASGAYRFPRIIDVGTGSGCIAITLAAELHAAHVIATDISADALVVAAANAARHGVADRVTLVRGAFFADVTDSVDIIVSNPPYVPERDRTRMAPEVAGHEPKEALFSGADGLDCIRALVALAPERLAPGGTLIFEFGFGQAPKIKQLIACQPQLRLVELKSDLQDIPRIAIATKR
jgi:release factor glutamine methyltransferase